MSDAETADFDDLLAFVEDELAFESGFYNDSYLERRFAARMRRTDTESYAEYRRLLERDEDERAELLDALSINVTGFFRNPDAWGRLRPILAELSEEDGPTRVWSAPCSDGREPYSAAMLALDEPRVDASDLSILATDINAAILEDAREGAYETSRTTDIEAELTPLASFEEYVEREGDSFRVREAVRELVEFERHDLIRGDAKGPFDLVFCRNLLIYIDAEFKVPIFETIADSLRSGGYLMIGMTETLPTACRDRFEPVDPQYRIYRKR